MPTREVPTCSLSPTTRVLAAEQPVGTANGIQVTIWDVQRMNERWNPIIYVYQVSASDAGWSVREVERYVY